MEKWQNELMLILGAICVIVLVAGLDYSNWSIDNTDDTPSNTTYDVYVGGSSTGTSVNGLYQDGTYSEETVYGSFTLS